MIFHPHDRLESTWAAVPFPSLHPTCPQQVPQGERLQVMDASGTPAGLCAGKCPALLGLTGSHGPRAAQLCPAQQRGGRSPGGWEGPCARTHTGARAHTQRGLLPERRAVPPRPTPLCLHSRHLSPFVLPITFVSLSTFCPHLGDW